MSAISNRFTTEQAVAIGVCASGCAIMLVCIGFYLFKRFYINMAVGRGKGPTRDWEGRLKDSRKPANSDLERGNRSNNYLGNISSMPSVAAGAAGGGLGGDNEYVHENMSTAEIVVGHRHHHHPTAIHTGSSINGKKKSRVVVKRNYNYGLTANHEEYEHEHDLPAAGDLASFINKDAVGALPIPVQVAGERKRASQSILVSQSVGHSPLPPNTDSPYHQYNNHHHDTAVTATTHTSSNTTDHDRDKDDGRIQHQLEAPLQNELGPKSAAAAVAAVTANHNRHSLQRVEPIVYDNEVAYTL